MSSPEQTSPDTTSPDTTSPDTTSPDTNDSSTQSIPPPPILISKPKALVVSFIRHGEVCCLSLTPSTFSHPILLQCPSSFAWVDPDLTETGEVQAETLGERWKDVRIDHLYCSTMKRAYQTALPISQKNKAHPEILKSWDLVERKYGELVRRRAAYNDDITSDVYGTSNAPALKDINRDFRPSEGGESLNDVSLRARAWLRVIVALHGKETDAPIESFKKDEEEYDPESLPADLPHVVAVSHNIFLSELYESLLNQGVPWDNHIYSNWRYKHTGWFVFFTFLILLPCVKFT
jgi:broad specificity phosphatase PhoE